MKKSFYMALLFVGISLSSLVSAGTDAISTAGRSDLAFASNSSDFPVSPSVEGLNGGPAIVTLPISGTLCSGSTVVVDFTCSVLFGISNTFNVELSDASGSFTSPVIISVAPLSLVGLVTGGQIFAQIPNGTPFGTAYRIRVVSTDPVILGSDNGADIVIKTDIAPPVPTVSVNGPTDFCFGSATTFLTSSVAQNNLWFPGGVNTNPFIGVVSGGCYYTQVTGSNGCATSSYPVCINVNTPIFTFLGYFENGSLVTTSDTTITICQGDSAQLGLIIEGGVAPFDIFYTPNGLDVVTVNDVGVPFNAESYVYTFFASQAGFYQTIGITDNFPTNCGSNGNAGLVSIQITPPPVTTFSYAPFCGPVSPAPEGDAGFLIGGTYTFDVVPVDGAILDASTGVISNATIGHTYIIRYTVEGPFCAGSSIVSVTVNATDITAFSIAPFCSNNPSAAPIGASGFSTGGTYSFETTPVDGALIDASTGIISNASGNTTYTVVYTSPEGVCQNNSSTSVSTIESPVLSGTVVNTQCGQASGSIDASVSGGLSPYSYSWSNAATTEDISLLAADSYTLTATDANGCSVDSSFTIINTNSQELELVVSNAVCGSVNGSIDLTVSGGTGPFEFLWTPGDATSEDILGLSAGAYSVQVTDITTTCVVSGSASVINQDAPAVTFTSENALCGVASGSIDVTVSLNGGSSAITHSWSNGETTEDIFDLNAGTYIDTVRDGNSCEVIISVTIINSNQFTATSSVVNPTCALPVSGSVDVTIEGGTEPFTFVWTPNSSSSTEDVSGLAPGTYTVEISDAANCSTSVVSTIAPLNTILLSSTQINATCGNTDGSIDIEVTGGSGSYSYLWNTLELTQNIAGLDTGSYSVTVTDLLDETCTASESVTIIYGNLPQLSFITGPVSCTSNDGTVDLTVAGGSSNFAFVWTGPGTFSETSEDLVGLASGVYNVTVTDLNTTCVVSGSADVESVNPPVITAVVVNTTCGQDNGIIDITVTGGTEPFTIDWSNFASGQDQINLAAGSYTITLTDDNGCVASEEYTINGSVQPTSDLIIIQPACNADTGSVEVTLTNATNPVIYSWKKDGAAFASFANIADLAPGTYVLTATDGSGCSVLDTAVLAYPNIPTLATAITNTLCGLETGEIDLTVEGGSGTYTFLWDDSFGFTASTEDITNLAFGCYNVTVTDENGCEASTQACIENENAPVTTFEVVNPSCNLDNGSITAIITGGVLPYSISWTGTTSGDTTITDLASGTYYLVVIDDNGCESIDSVSLSNTGVPSFTANSTNPSCGNADGAIDVVPAGGVAPYTYLWTPNGETTEDLSNLTAGTYGITLSDDAGCEVAGPFTLTNTNSPQLSTTQVNALCGASDGSVDLTVLGGSDDFNYAWTGPAGFTASSEDVSLLEQGAYSVVVTDNQTGCSDSITVTITNSNSFDVSALVTSATCNLDNGSVTLIITGGTEPFTYSWCNGQTTQDATGLAPGTCEVTVTDGSGCVFTDSYTIGNISGLALSGNTINATCGQCNGSIALQLTDAANPVTFLWSNGASSQTITDLCAGDYSVTATDANGCSDSFSATVIGGTNPEVTSIQVNTNCGESTGFIDISVLNGTQPYSYSWSGPSGFTANSEDISGLAAGAYTVIVTDGAGCSGTLTATILNLNDPVLSFSVTNASCGSSTGAIDLTVSVATGPFVYSWSGPSGFTASSEDLTAIGVGLYTVTVTSGSCSVTADTTIINTDAPTASVSLSNDTICSGEPLTLSIDVVGFGPFTFVYTDGIVNYTETLSSAGTFSVAVSPVTTTTYSMVSLISDAAPTCFGNFPIGSANIVVNPTPVQPLITANGPLSFCEGGSVILTSSSQTGNIWSNLGPDQLNQSITVIDSGVFTVTVTNSSGCSATSASVEVTVQPAASTFAGNDTTICAGTALQLQGTGADTYLWSPSIYLSGTISSNPVCTPFETTTYFLTGTNGCGVTVDTLVITVLPSVNTSLGNDLTVCPGETVNLAVEDIAGATYAWEPAGTFIGASNTSSVSFVATSFTSVSVTTTNSNGCFATDTILINLNTPPAAPVITAQGPTTFCQGDSLILQSSTGNFVIWSNGLENFDEILVTTSGTYYVTSTDGICSATSDSIVVTVTPNPTATILVDGNTTVCIGTCVELSAVQLSGLSWTLPNTSTSTASTLSACESGFYLLNVSENGCVGTDSVLITIVPLPEQPIITLDGPDVICENEFLTLVSSYATGNQWLFNNNPILGETNNTITVSIGGSYSVQYSNGLGCTVTSPVQVITVKPVTLMSITASADTVLCGNNPETVQLTASPGFVIYEWSTTESTQIISINGGGTYTVTGTNQDGCVTQGSITFITAPSFNLNLVSPIYYDDYNVTIQGASDGSIDLTVDPSDNYTYSWSNGATTEDLANIPAGVYTVTVTDEFGCPQTGTIEVKEPDAIKLPNGFTPNGDGFNDFYVIKGIQGYPNSQVDIFNRWGNLVYSKKGYTNDWNGLSNDGNQLPDATYFIVVDLNMDGKDNVKGFIDIRRK